MKIEIDQSGRVEYTSVPTVVADSLGNSLLLTAVNKQSIQHIFRQTGRSRRFVIEIFAFLTAYLISQSYHPDNLYIIDTEYPGKDAEIKASLFRYFSRLNCTLPSYAISFHQIGKKSKAHTTAYTHYSKPTLYRDRIVSRKKILEFVL